MTGDTCQGCAHRIVCSKYNRIHDVLRTGVMIIDDYFDYLDKMAENCKQFTRILDLKKDVDVNLEFIESIVSQVLMWSASDISCREYIISGISDLLVRALDSYYIIRKDGVK